MVLVTIVGAAALRGSAVHVAQGVSSFGDQMRGWWLHWLRSEGLVWFGRSGEWRIACKSCTLAEGAFPAVYVEPMAFVISMPSKCADPAPSFEEVTSTEFRFLDIGLFLLAL